MHTLNVYPGISASHTELLGSGAPVKAADSDLFHQVRTTWQCLTEIALPKCIDSSSTISIGGVKLSAAELLACTAENLAAPVSSGRQAADALAGLKSKLGNDIALAVRVGNNLIFEVTQGSKSPAEVYPVEGDPVVLLPGTTGENGLCRAGVIAGLARLVLERADMRDPVVRSAAGDLASTCEVKLPY